ncbi:hypothetical protein [Streptomyces sp. NPDC086787]|uniref:hypothetical protein n=1 Tax=Streptomyces sp. NPDC086787 TaxID=3365759 RepID=UPI003818205B
MLITDAAVRETAATLAQSLGGDWTIDPEAPADDSAHLICDGRAISFRPTFGGKSVQLWITGNAAPSLPDGATPAEHTAHDTRMAARLPEGHRYNKAASLITAEDEDPAVIILRTLRDHLLPAFEYKPHYVGHRPWVELFEKAMDALNDDPTATPGTSLRDCGPEAHTRPHDEDLEPENQDEPDMQPDLDPEAEANPPAEPEPQTQSAASDDGPDSTAPTGKPSSESDHQQPDTAPEATPAEEGAGEISEPAATRRPRKRPTKRRPKASTT